MKLHLDKSCRTCKFNFDGICACGEEYNNKISDLNNMCEDWSINLEHYCFIESNLPWYLASKFRRNKIELDELLYLIELDEQNVPIDLNIFEVVEQVYGLIFPSEIAEALGVSEQVLCYAYVHGTPLKRINDFSNKLCIPIQYFEKVTTMDISEITKCKDKFLKKHNGSLDYIKKSAEERLAQKEELENRINYPIWKKELNNKLKKYSSLSNLNHDISDDYKLRDYVIAILFQKGEYKGNIYYEYKYGGYGLNNSIMSDILRFIDNLDVETINEYNKTCYLINDMNLTADTNNINFILHNDRKESMEISTSVKNLQDYIVGYKMIDCVGHGKKKERRKCLECKNFTLSKTSAKGYCSVRKEDVQRSRIVCAFDFVPKEDK
ncbi:MAG: hypothetical protein J1F23_05410 [Oscillospiraceae bacterium]|nr:hypothetical protein [Oscillospiraceae bacterium]